MKEDIIRMAREAGIVVTGEAVWELCALVAAAEREACAKVADKWAEGPERNYSELIADEIRSRGQA